jgi:hypothetical protein
MHSHSDVRRESVFRCDADRNAGGGSWMTKEGACAKFAEMATRNDNDLEPDRAAVLATDQQAVAF